MYECHSGEDDGGDRWANRKQDFYLFLFVALSQVLERLKKVKNEYLPLLNYDVPSELRIQNNIFSWSISDLDPDAK